MEFGARLHAFLNRLGRPDEWAVVRDLHATVARGLRHHGLDSEAGRLALADELASTIAEGPFAEHLADILRAHFDYERLFDLPVTHWDDPPTYAELWKLRERLVLQRAMLDDFDRCMQLLADTYRTILDPVFEQCPHVLGPAEGTRLSTRLLTSIPDLGRVLEHVIAVPFAGDLNDSVVCLRLREQLEANLILASGGNPTKPPTNAAYRLPTRSSLTDPDALAGEYLAHTPLLALLAYDIPFAIPAKARFEHHWIVAPPGAGKSTTLQGLIEDDLDRVAQGEASVIVMESNRDLIKAIEGMARFAPGGDLDGRLIVIDCEDVEYPVALNLFDIGLRDIHAASPRDREALFNSAIAMLDYVFRALLGAEMTSRQSTLFNFAIQLLLRIPGATLDTLLDMMQAKGLDDYQAPLAETDPDTRRFFATKFMSPEFDQTKRQVVDRLFAIKRIRTLARMFAAPRTKLDLYAEMGRGRVILINCAKSLLQEEGVEIVSRFFLAMILLAAEKRQLLPQGERLPTYVYIDECQDVIRRDEKLPIILDQARKFRVAMILAHQRLEQMTPPVLHALYGSTAIKFAAKLNDTALARQMATTAEFIYKQPNFAYAAYVRGTTEHAVSLRIPHVDLAAAERMTPEEQGAIREAMQARYCLPLTIPDDPETAPEPPADDPDDADTTPQPWD
jgi:hypothetical protein